jgi:GAF domain-containing protein
MSDHRRGDDSGASGGRPACDSPPFAAAQLLTDAYRAVVGEPGLERRLAEVERQAAALTGASSTAIRPAGVTTGSDGVVAVPLPTGLGDLEVRLGGDGRRSEVEALLRQFVVLVAGPINDARLLRLTERLQRVGTLFDGVDDPDRIVNDFLDSGLGLTGARFGVVLLRDDDVLRVVGARSSGRFALDDAIGTHDERPLAVVARTGVADYRGDLATVRQAPGELVAEDEPEQAWAALPMASGERILGSLGLRFDGRQPFDVVQRQFLLAVADRLGVALERSLAFQRERRARLDAERAMARVQAMRDLASDLARAATRKAVADVLLVSVMNRTAADIGLVAVARPHTHHIEVLSSRPADRELYLPPEDIRRSVNDALNTGEPFELRTSSDVERALHTDIAATEFGAASLGFYPIVYRGRQMGFVLLGWTDPATFDGVDREELKTQIVMAAPVLQRAARHELEHDIADRMQRALLAVPRLELPEIRWSTRYRTGTTGIAGGDWYDVVRRGGDEVAFFIGDIVGRGVAAASAMGQLRSAARALCLRCEDPGELLTALDEYATTTGAGLYSTLAMVVVDTSSGEVRYAAAGHPPPLLRHPDGTTSVLDGGRSSLLGAHGERSTATAKLSRGGVVVLYTDGLVERRGEPLSTGVERALQVLAEEGRSGDRRRLSQRLVERLVRGRDGDDDVAVLTLTYVGRGGAEQEGAAISGRVAGGHLAEPGDLE